MSVLTSDPTSNVLIDWWLERGAKLDVWTDEEAERCRLVAFDVAQLSGPIHRRGMLRPSKPGLVRHWYAAHGTIAGTASGGTYNTNVFATERFFSVYDQADFALETWVEVVLLRELASGRKLPAKFRPTLKRYAGPVAEVVR